MQQTSLRSILPLELADREQSCDELANLSSYWSPVGDDDDKGRRQRSSDDDRTAAGCRAGARRGVAGVVGGCAVSGRVVMHPSGWRCQGFLRQCTSDPSKKGSTCHSPPSGKQAAAQADHQSPPLAPAGVELTGPKPSNCTYAPDPRDPTRCLTPPTAPWFLPCLVNSRGVD